MPEDSTNSEERFFSFMKGEIETAPSTTNTATLQNNTADEDSDDVSQFLHERLHHETRVNNMRMQFAWAAIILAFMWIFVIIYLILSHAIGYLYLRQFHSILWGISITLILSTLLYGIFMIITGYHAYKSKLMPEPENYRRQYLSDYWRTLAPNIAILSPIIGVITYLLVWHSSCIPTPIRFDRLSDSVLITLITSTTVSVLGILGAVMFWLFPRNKTEK